MGFGSCHSFGVAVGLRGYGMCQMRGAIRSTLFLKMRRVGCINFLLSPKFVSFDVNRLESRVLSTWKIFIRKLSAVFFENDLFLGHIATNVYV